MNLDIKKARILKNLSNLKIINDRIRNEISNIRKSKPLKEYYENLKSNHKIVHRYLISAKKKKIKTTLTTEELLANIDNRKMIDEFVRQVQAISKGFREQAKKEKADKHEILNFEQKKVYCLNKLANNIPLHKISELRACSNYAELNKFLNELPPILLFKLKIRRSKYGLDHLTESSVYKVIYTGQTN